MYPAASIVMVTQSEEGSVAQVELGSSAGGAGKGQRRTESEASVVSWYALKVL